MRQCLVNSVGSVRRTDRQTDGRWHVLRANATTYGAWFVDPRQTATSHLCATSRRLWQFVDGWDDQTTTSVVHHQRSPSSSSSTPTGRSGPRHRRSRCRRHCSSCPPSGRLSRAGTQSAVHLGCCTRRQLRRCRQSGAWRSKSEYAGLPMTPSGVCLTQRIEHHSIIIIRPS